jgi:hypothetical protein
MWYKMQSLPCRYCVALLAAAPAPQHGKAPAGANGAFAIKAGRSQAVGGVAPTAAALQLLQAAAAAGCKALTAVASGLLPSSSLHPHGRDSAAGEVCKDGPTTRESGNNYDVGNVVAILGLYLHFGVQGFRVLGFRVSLE